MSIHSYTCDASGWRVEKTGNVAESCSVNGTGYYLHDLQGHVVGLNIIGSGWGGGYVYLGSQLIAEYANGTTYFIHPDHLGSTRLLTTLNQSVCESLDYLPFGEQAGSGSCPAGQRFTGDEWDEETGLDHAQFRQYSSAQGRWISPDPAGLAAVDTTNPQSWNRYAYVLNNPLSYVDNSGLVCTYYTNDDRRIESKDFDSDKD